MDCFGYIAHCPSHPRCGEGFNSGRESIDIDVKCGSPRVVQGQPINRHSYHMHNAMNRKLPNVQTAGKLFMNSIGMWAGCNG